MRDVAAQPAITPNIEDYDSVYNFFNWEIAYRGLNGLPSGNGLNMAYEAVERHAEVSIKNHTALRFIKSDRTTIDISYAELSRLSNQFANLLNFLGVAKGETVFTLTGRIPELYIAAFGTLKKLALFCPLFSVFGPEPIYQRLSRGNAKILVTTLDLFTTKVKPLLDRLPALSHVLITDIEKDIDDLAISLPLRMSKASSAFTIPDTKPTDDALLHFTSGTTGMPKGAVHVHGAVLTHLVTGKQVLDFHPGDIYWCTADPGWVTGTSYGIISPLVNGVTSIIDEEEFDATRWYSVLEEHKVSIWYTAPTAIRRLMRMNIEPKKQFNLEHLRMILSVGEPLHADAVKWCQKTFEVPVLDNWWQTETGGIMISNFRSLPVRPGSMGKPLPGVKAAIAAVTESSIQIIKEPDKEGHLVLKRGWPSMFKTYLHEDERYAKCFRGEWYLTGDLARCDADGYYWFVGRADDIIKTSGHMVGPFEVESSLMEHWAVSEAAVIGKPDPLIGEIVKAFIVLKSGTTINENLKLDIMAHARKKLGAAVAPKEISIVASIPKTRSGKILRRLLKARELGLPEGDLSTLEPS
ncbi:acetate--CoA ligase [Chryseotalea sanaruensis]|uniref:acetate--CoA ligase n=1 Tax=Chryseotalea sanaruensis TaxID=2482724 RepID=A0A401U664_9BACT|nr:acetate--CoA ligase [Chryseotalea sanaruensis]GCC50375.1 acetate--CoA ligase [Chryseotalea sanaruensis]